MGFLSDNFISDFLVTVIKWANEFIGDYSLVIILLTLVIRFIILPLDIKQKKSSRLMINVGPEVESLRKRYANNPDQLNRKVQELYKERGVKPMAGCLPMLIQLPLLFAFFGALRVIASEQTVSLILRAAEGGAESVALPSWLWVHNIWQADSGLVGVLPSPSEFLGFLQTNASYITPQTMLILQNHGLISYASGTLTVTEAYQTLTSQMVSANGLVGFSNGWFGLPIIAGVTLFLQQKFMSKSNPQAAGTPGTGKFMLYFFPLFSVYICATSNAVFSIYWVVSNVYSVALALIYDGIIKAREKKNPAPIRR